MMMGDADEVLETQRDADREHRGLGPQQSAGRSIQIGDNIHHHYQQTTGSPGVGTLGKLAIAAALAAGTGGAGLGLWAALRSTTETIVEKTLPGTDMGVEAGDTILE